MENETLTESETTVNTVDTTEADKPTTSEDIDNMNDEEFAQLMDGDTQTSKATEDETDVKPTDDLDALYATQMQDPDAQLDKPILLKFNGTVHKVDSIKELKNLAEQGISFTKKSQDMSEQRQLLTTLEQNGYDAEALRNLASTHKGSELVEADMSSAEIESVAQEILSSNYADSFKSVIGSMPESVTAQMRQDPQMLKAIAYDVESGLAQSIMPEVNRLMDIKGLSFEKAYVQAGNDYNTKKESVNIKRETLKSQPTSNSHVNSPTSNEDVWKMDSKQFEKYFNSL